MREWESGWETRFIKDWSNWSVSCYLYFLRYGERQKGTRKMLVKLTTCEVSKFSKRTSGEDVFVMRWLVAQCSPVTCISDKFSSANDYTL